MANRGVSPPTTGGALPSWRAPRTLIREIVQASLSGHDLIDRFRAERFEVFITGHLAAWVSAGILLPVIEYIWVLRSPWLLTLVAISTVHSVGLLVALRLARRCEYDRSITLVCMGTWAATILMTLVSPPLLPVMILVSMVPVVFAEPYVGAKRAQVFVVITTVCALVMALLARFTHIADAVHLIPRWIETSFIAVAVPFNAFHLMLIVGNNASALRTSEEKLAERAAELTASRARVITAADEERRRLERDLHDGAQQHLVALSVLIRLARNAEPDRQHALLTEASDLIESAITEIRRLAHGIYPPLLVSGGLADALPGLAAQAAVPVYVDLAGLGRYPQATEAALYYCCSEALQNAAKHGGPGTSVTLTARTDGPVLHLTISDDGRGFQTATVGAGLTNMADRLSGIGGDLVVESAPGQGTRITAVVGPLEEPAGVRTPPQPVLRTR